MQLSAVSGVNTSWPTACHIEGPTPAGGAYLPAASFLHFGHTGFGIKIRDNLGSRSLKNISTYRTQPAPGGGGYTPTAHDYDIDIEGGQDIELENITFLNPTKAINVRGMQVGAVACGRISFKGLRSQPLSEGIRLTHFTDVVYLDDIHFWPFWSANANVTTYTRTNLSALLIGRVDNPEIGRFFCWGAQRGLTSITRAPSDRCRRGPLAVWRQCVRSRQLQRRHGYRIGRGRRHRRLRHLPLRLRPGDAVDFDGKLHLDARQQR